MQDTPATIRAALAQAKEAFECGDVETERRALQSVPEASLSDAQLVRLVSLHVEDRALREAAALVRSAMNRRFKSDRHLLRLAFVLASAQRADLASKLLERAVRHSRPSPSVINYWASLVADRLARPAEVMAAVKHPSSDQWPPWLRALVRGKALAAFDDTIHAIANLNQSAELAPDEPLVWFELAILQRRIGLVAESLTSLHKVVELDRGNVTARRMLGYEHRYSADDDLLSDLERLTANSAKLPPSSRVELHYALAKAYEDTERLDEAFSEYAIAGQIQKRLSPWDHRQQQRLNTRLMDPATTDWILNEAERGIRDEQPVFIVGMPRSGTTLVEQVIGSHPDAFGAGEMRAVERLLHGIKVGSFTLLTAAPEDIGIHCGLMERTMRARGQAYLSEIKRRSSSATRVIDKMPGNYQWVGLILAMLPGARFIHCRRHPVDTCFSQYRLYFGSEIPYSYDLRDLGRAYRAYDDIMRHWSRIVPPNQFHEICYEDLVRDFERRARELISFCGLPWDSACMDYASSRRPVRTASATQVRHSPYTTAVGRWRRYRTYLEPLIEEVADLIAEYEECSTT